MQGALDDTFHLLSHSEILRRGVQAFFSLEPVEDGGGTIAGLTNAVCIMSVYSRTTNDYWKPVLPRTPASDAYGWVTEIPTNLTIHKERAIRMYRFHHGDLDNVPFNDGFNQFISHYFNEYNERDIEWRAWKVHGGPIKYWEFLKREQKEGRLKSNLFPYDYSPGLDTTSAALLPPRAELEDRYVCKSDILIKSKRALAPWIWDACNVVLDHVLLDGAIPRCPDDLTAVREDAMERAVAFIDSQRKLYARRPEEPLGPSSSKALLWLRRILEQAPLAPVPGSALWGAPFPGLDFVRAEEERYSYYDWNEAYLERVFTTACEVVEELGAGRDGWRTVRWEVYDKYSQSPSFGFWYDPEAKGWIDNGNDWLDCRRHSRKGLRGHIRSRCAAGFAFNRLLPSPVPSKADQ